MFTLEFSNDAVVQSKRKEFFALKQKLEGNCTNDLNSAKSDLVSAVDKGDKTAILDCQKAIRSLNSQKEILTILDSFDYQLGFKDQNSYKNSIQERFNLAIEKYLDFIKEEKNLAVNSLFTHKQDLEGLFIKSFELLAQEEAASDLSETHILNMVKENKSKKKVDDLARFKNLVNRISTQLLEGKEGAREFNALVLSLTRPNLNNDNKDIEGLTTEFNTIMGDFLSAYSNMDLSFSNDMSESTLIDCNLEVKALDKYIKQISRAITNSGGKVDEAKLKSINSITSVFSIEAREWLLQSSTNKVNSLANELKAKQASSPKINKDIIEIELQLISAYLRLSTKDAYLKALNIFVSAANHIVDTSQPWHKDNDLIGGTCKIHQTSGFIDLKNNFLRVINSLNAE